MKQKKSNFFIKVKNAVFNFDEYKTFAEEKISKSILYLVFLMIIFSVIITTCITIKMVEKVNIAKNKIEEKCPEFGFENSILIINGENKEFIIDLEESYFGIIINSEKENIEDIPEANNYQSFVAILKDKLVLKNNNSVQNTITYEALSERIDLNNLNKQTVIEVLSSNAVIVGYIVFFIVLLISLFITLSLIIVLYVFMLSLVGFVLSRIIRVRLKYSSIFNISIYSITLSTILYLIYMVINMFTGFKIIYFDIAYRAISYIYLTTALLIIKSDLIKQNMELTKILQVQKQIREEKQKEEKTDDEEKKEKEPKKKEKKKEENDKGQAPEGTGA